ncbi:MAG: hypothetical protein J6X18_05650 [Bacteroidales bacterium]|nr:hypothetical protein [Bacteroidales bacterium]
MKKRKNKDNAFVKASVEMLEQAENAIKSKYSQYDGTEEVMEDVLDKVEEAKKQVIHDAKKKGITKGDVKNAVYSEPNEFEKERYKRHLEKRGVTDDEVRDKKHYCWEDFDNEAMKQVYYTEERNKGCQFIPENHGYTEMTCGANANKSRNKQYYSHVTGIQLEDGIESKPMSEWKKTREDWEKWYDKHGYHKYDAKHPYVKPTIKVNDSYIPNEELDEYMKSDNYKKWYDRQTSHTPDSPWMYYTTMSTPVLTNRFMCEISIGSYNVEPYMVCDFNDNIYGKALWINLFVDEEHIELIDILEDAYKNKRNGRVVFSLLSPNGEPIRKTVYLFNTNVDVTAPYYRYQADTIAKYSVCIGYYDKHNWNEDDENEETLSDEIYKNFKENEALSENVISKNLKHAIGGAKDIIDVMEDNVVEIEDDGTAERKWFNENFGNLEEVKELQEGVAKKKVNPPFAFDDFGTALEFFKFHLLPNGTRYQNVSKFDEVDKDLEDNSRATVVICSRCCGMTTHMLAWALAKISTEPSTRIWYVEHNANAIDIILRNIPSDIRDIEWLKSKNFSRIIQNTENKSEIQFVSINQCLESLFVGMGKERMPNYVIYDNMAFYPSNRINNFITLLEELETCSNQFVKEICVSTPSKGGSMFNFLALIARNPIYIDWKDGLLGSEGKNWKWGDEMMQMLGKDNFDSEMCCKLDVEDDVCTGDEPWAQHFEKGIEDFENKEEEVVDLRYDYTKDSNNNSTEYVIDMSDFPEEDRDEWVEIKDDCRKKKCCKHDVFEDDYGNQFPDEYPEDKNYNSDYWC